MSNEPSEPIAEEPDPSGAPIDKPPLEGDEPRNPLADALAQRDEASKRALQAQAELENFRKRMRREVEDERRYAALPLLRDLLGVADNLQRALDAAREGSSAGLLEGVELVSQQLLGILQQHGLRPIPGVGEPFDPNVHEALAQQPSEHAAGHVALVHQAGYKLHDRVVRPAQVIVSLGK